jgi:putative peptidoglycan lipid II flippase
VNQPPYRAPRPPGTPRRPASRPVDRPAPPSDPERWSYGWYEPDAPTIEMPAIADPALDEPVVLDERILIEPEPEKVETEAERRHAQADRTQRASALVAAGILLSRMAGLFREVAIARYLGIGAAGDAFRAALRIPNLLQNLLGEGVLSASFIPVYAKLRSDHDEEEAGRLAGAIAGLMLALTGVLAVVGIVLARPLTTLLAPGFEGEKFDLTVKLTRIMFPGIGFLVLSAWCLGVLNSHRKFFLSYVAPVLWNAAQVVALVAVAMGGATEESLAEALAWGVLVGGGLQLAVQLGPTRRLLGQLRLSLDTRRRSVRTVLSRFGPVILARGVVQLLAYIDLVLASFLAEGAVSIMMSSTVLYLLPISLFGMSVAAAELPDLSQVEVYDRQTRQNYRRRLEDGMARISFYVMPTATLFIVVGDVIVAAVFQHGNFSPADTWAVWLTLAAFALGLPATTSSRLLQNGLYALGEAKTPARLAMVRVSIAAVVGLAFMFPLDRLFMSAGGIDGWSDMWALGPLPSAIRNDPGTPHLGVVALALGASVAAWIEYRLLSTALAWRIGRSRLAGRWLNPIAGSCAVAGGVAYLLVLATDGWPSLVQAVVVLAPAGLAYMFMTRWLGIPESVSLFSRLQALRARISR